jgi:gliding motility-associated-like protein
MLFSFTVKSQNCQIIDPANIVIIDASCNFGSDGQIDLTLLDPLGNYSYSWDGIPGSLDNVNLQAGQYSLQIIDLDNNLCIQDSIFTISTISTSLTVDSNVLCHGEATGQATVDNPSFGTGPYLYNWSDGQFTQTATNLVAGIYTVTVTDQFGCIAVGSIEILNLYNPLSVTTTLITDIICDGDSTGAAQAENAIGGVSTAPYTYSWDNGQTTQVAIDLWEAIHTVTVMDSAGCTAQSSIDIESLNDPIDGDINIINHVSCFGGSDASAVLSSSGGVLPHSYQWSFGQTYVNGSGPDTAFNLAYGGYNVVIVDAEGCNHTVTFDIDQPAELYVIAVGNGAPIPSSVLYTQPVQCYGFDDGTAYAFVPQNSGTPGYYFVWDSIQGVSANYNTGQNIDSLTPGIHTVYVTDINGCTASDTVLITEPTELVVDIIDSLSVYEYCANTFSGELCAVASGGTPNYLYQWDNTPQTTPCATNLNANVYTVTVTDDRNCIADDTFDLDSITNSFSEDSVVFLADSVSCFGLFDGQLTASSISGSSNYGGVAPYLYSWFGPGGYSGTGSAITTLGQGGYSVSITDVNNCVINTGTYLYQPDYFQFDIYNTVDETCDGSNNGQIYIEVEGGTGTYYYDIDQAGIFPFTNFDTIYNDSLIINLTPGNYSIYVTDDNGCEGSVMSGGDFQAQIFGGLQVDVPTISDIDTDSVSCFNISDGVAVFNNPNSLFTYTWESDDGTGNPDGSDVSNGAGPSWDGFSAGIDYFLVVHYADSASFGVPYSACDQFVGFTFPPSPTQILPSISVVADLKCYGDSDGKISLSSTGGVPPYTFIWDTTSVFPNGYQHSGVLEGVDEYLNDLTIGTYAVTILDADSCSSVTVFETITEPAPFISDVEVLDHVSCNGEDDGIAQVTAVGGVTIISFDWSDGQTVNPATGLSAGTYSVTLKDDNGCPFTDTVIVLQPAAPIASVEAVDLYVGNYDVSCNGFVDAAAIVTGTGVLFEWTHVSGSPSFTTVNYNTGQVLSEGDYDIIAYDIDSCVGLATIYISEPPLLEIDVLISNPSASYQISCFDEDDGWARVVNIDGKSLLANGGGVQANNSLGYYISWEDNLGNNYGSDTIAENLAGDTLGAPSITYTVTVEDANGCEDNATTAPFIQPILFDVKVSTVNYSGPFHAPYAITFIDSTVSLEPYTYDWTWHDGFESFSNVNAGDYELFTHDFSQEDVGENMVSVNVSNDVTECEETIEFIIEVQGFEDTLIDLNVFTPNSDGINDEFVFGEYAMNSVDVQIFNRWGQMVYSWVGENKSWKGKGIDGSDLPEGVYFYMFKADGVDGHYYERKGSITLLR